jgi:hypothetical protein
MTRTVCRSPLAVLTLVVAAPAIAQAPPVDPAAAIRGFARR